jgi:uncharacterized linocin/CFP29 family protein
MSYALSQEQMNALAQAQAAKLRIARRALPCTIGHHYVDSVEGHQLAAPGAGHQMSIRPNQRLQPLEMSWRFFLHRGQSGDPSALRALITRAAADLAQAEDAVILRGPDAGPLLIGRYHITFDPDELQTQERLLPVGAGNIAVALLDSIIAGIQTLQVNGQYGEYYAIVSPELYSEAYRNRRTRLDAPIYQIQPLLAPNGFLSSDVLVDRTGVIFSLSRGTISLAVPVDTYVDCSLPEDGEGRPRFRVAEQVRLIIDDEEARVALA